MHNVYLLYIAMLYDLMHIRLKSWLKSQIGQERLTSLVLLYVHRDME